MVSLNPLSNEDIETSDPSYSSRGDERLRSIHMCKIPSGSTHRREGDARRSNRSLIYRVARVWS